VLVANIAELQLPYKRTCRTIFALCSVNLHWLNYALR